MAFLPVFPERDPPKGCRRWRCHKSCLAHMNCSCRDCCARQIHTSLSYFSLSFYFEPAPRFLISGPVIMKGRMMVLFFFYTWQCFLKQRFQESFGVSRSLVISKCHLSEFWYCIFSSVSGLLYVQHLVAQFCCHYNSTTLIQNLDFLSSYNYCCSLQSLQRKTQLYRMVIERFPVCVCAHVYVCLYAPLLWPWSCSSWYPYMV